MAPIPGRALLTRVIYRVHEAAQQLRTQEDYELATITLRLLGLLRSQSRYAALSSDLSSREATGNILDAASCEAFGCSFAKWRARNLERQSLLAWELSKLIPDYDATRQHSNWGAGNLHTIPKKPSVEKSRMQVRVMRDARAARVIKQSWEHSTCTSRWLLFDPRANVCGLPRAHRWPAILES